MIIKTYKIKPFFPSLLAVIFAILFYLGVYWFGADLYASMEVLAWPMVGQTVIVDPGHGGFDPGAIGVGGGLEKEINLEVGQRLGAILRQSGANVVFTRERDEALGEDKSADLAARVAIAKAYPEAIYISVQANGFPQSIYFGAQTFYHPRNEAGKLLAETIQAELIRIMKNTTRQALAHTDAYILKHIESPAVIVEVGFLSNAKEESLLRDAAYQEKIAWSIFNGILYYFSDQGQAGER